MSEKSGIDKILKKAAAKSVPSIKKNASSQGMTGEHDSPWYDTGLTKDQLAEVARVNGTEQKYGNIVVKDRIP